MNRPLIGKKNNSNNYFKIKKNTVREGFNTVGTIGVWYSIIGTTVTILIFLAITLYMNLSYHKDWVKVEAEVLDDNCRETRNDNNNTVLKCDYKIRYMVNEKEYVTTLYNKSVTYPIHKNDKKYFEVEYNPSNPYEVDFVFEKAVLNLVMGVVLFILIVIDVILIYYRNNTIVKGLATVHMASSMLRN
jgi:hypothetical protein